MSISFGAPYLLFMCQKVDVAALIDALNYSVQTITTVGYGNWVSSDPPCNVLMEFSIPLTGVKVSGVLLMKLVSIPFMLVGAGVFAVTIGLVVEWIKLRGVA